jgi:hypothetical protein
MAKHCMQLLANCAHVNGPDAGFGLHAKLQAFGGSSAQCSRYSAFMVHCGMANRSVTLHGPVAEQTGSD